MTFPRPGSSRPCPEPLALRTATSTSPQGPGLGISLKEDLIKEHLFKKGFFNMFEADWHIRQSKK